MGISLRTRTHSGICKTPCTLHCWTIQPNTEWFDMLGGPGKFLSARSLRSEKARDFGLTVQSGMPSNVLNLMSLYPQPVRRQPTVEYFPEPRRFKGVGSQKE